GALEDDDSNALRKVANLLTPTDQPIEQTHYLIVLGRLRAPRPASITSRVADVLVKLDRRLTEQQLNRDSNWPLRIGELYAGLAAHAPALHDAVLRHKEFGRPDHVLFAQAPGFDPKRAAAVFLQRARVDAQYAWSADLVKLVGSHAEAEAL